MSFNPIERRLAEALNGFPVIKQTAKSIYQRLNYYVFGDRNFTLGLHPSVSISTPVAYFDANSTSEAEFFGYFDTSPWNQTMDAMVYHRPTDDGRVALHLYRDTTSRSLTTSSAWNYQQGCRTRWHPAANDHILYNDVRDGNVVTSVIDTTGSEAQVYDRPLQSMSPTGDEFISLNYHRLDYNRPDYGYGLDDRSQIQHPSEDGLWRVDMETGSTDLIISLSELIENGAEQENHYLNHVLYNPSGDRFVFLHRWRGPQGRVSRLYGSEQSGEYRVLMDEGVVSHYCWLDDDRLLVWGRSERFGDGYHIIDIKSKKRQYVHALDKYSDGHPSVSPNGRWIVTDTYPDRGRRRHLILFDLEELETIEIGQFLSPFDYEGSNRCDLHPRWSPDGTMISIDSAHEGTRRSYILDVSDIVSDPSRRNT